MATNKPELAELDDILSRIDSIVVDAYQAGASGATFAASKMDKDYFKARILIWRDQELSERVDEYKQERIKKNKSYCGCPMCEHHTSTYMLAPYKLSPQKTNDKEGK